jgi:hypothetical protein
VIDADLKILAAKRLLMAGYLQPEGLEPWLDSWALGSGCSAAVYPLGDTLVAKVTSDSSDARAAVHVKALQDRGGGLNLTRVNGVFALGSHEHRPRFLIINERVEPLTESLRAAVSAADPIFIGGTQCVISVADRRARGVVGCDDLWCCGPWSKDWGLAAAVNMAGIAHDLKAAGMLRLADRDPSGCARCVLVDFGLAESPDVQIPA